MLEDETDEENEFGEYFKQNSDKPEKRYFKFENDDDEDDEPVVPVARTVSDPKSTTVDQGFVLVSNEDDPIKTSKSPKEKKIYEQKHREELDTEDIKLAIFKRKKLEDLNKKGQHLFLFTNIYSQEYLELFNNRHVKAWSILYNFRNKSLNSSLYDEVENFQARNFSNKRISHRLFNKFFNSIVNVCLERNYTIEKMPRCPTTGWNIDFLISKGKGSKEKIGFVFLLSREDLCYNIDTNQEQPTCIHKVIMKQIEQANNFKLTPIFENDFLKVKNSDDYIDRLISTKFIQMNN